MPSTNISVIKPTPNIAKHPTIKAGGTKGFLQWLKSDPQLSKIYEANKSRIAQLIGAPVGIAGLRGLGRIATMTGPSPNCPCRKPLSGSFGFGFATGSFGQTDTTGSSYSLPELTTSTGITDTTGSAYVPPPITTDLTASTPIDTSALASSIPSLAPINDSVTAAAPTAPTSSGWASDLSSIVSAASGLFQTADQLATAQKVTQTQLQRAQAGLPPLNLNSYGLSTSPGLNLGLSSSTQNTMLIAIGILAAVVLGSKMMRSRG